MMKINTVVARFFLSISVCLSLMSVSFSLYAAPLINQSGNILFNGSLELGSLDPVVGHNVPSAADGWYQWSNSGGTVISELITETEMQSNYSTGLKDGNRALRITTNGPFEGGFTFSNLFGQPAWDTSATLTFSGWLYVLTGSAGLSLGSNGNGFNISESVSTGQWEFISVTRNGSPNVNDEPLLYSSFSGASDFIVDSIWLNEGAQSTHPGQFSFVPEPAALMLLLTGLIGLGYRKSVHPG